MCYTRFRHKCLWDKFALEYRLMIMSTSQWIKHIIFYSNSFRDNTQNKTHSRKRSTCYNYPTGIAHLYFKINPICSIFCHCLFDFHAFLVLHLRLIWVDEVPVDLKAEYGEWFYRSRSIYLVKIRNLHVHIAYTYTEGSQFTLTHCWLHFVKWRVWNRYFFNENFMF